jgi:hypothetical protein
MTQKNLIKLVIVAVACTLFCCAPATARAGVVERTVAVTQTAPAHPHSDPHRRQPIRDDANAPVRRPADRQPRGAHGKAHVPGRTRTGRARQLES